MLRSRLLPSIVPALIMAACAPQGTGGEFLPVEGREDLSRAVFYSNIQHGIGAPISIQVPEGTMSLLIEVQADTGAFFVTELLEPDSEGKPDRNVAESGLVTRGGRMMGGQAAWLYPNVPERSIVPGTYQLTLRGKVGDDPDAALIESKRVEVTVIAKKEMAMETCMINLDFLIDTTYLEGSPVKVAQEVDAIYRPYGIGIGFSFENVDTGAPDIALGDQSATKVIDELVKKAKHDQMNQFGQALQDGMIVAMVRSIGGTAVEQGTAMGSDPLGYSVGLPGPYANDRATSAILIAAGKFNDGEYINLEGVAPTLAHEMGHYLGMLHLSEPHKQDGSFPNEHDQFADTPQCGAEGQCEDAFLENVMISTAWAQRNGTDPDDRRKLSPGQIAIAKRHPLCVPTELPAVAPTEPTGPPACDLACTLPQVCSIVNGQKACMPGCDPTEETPCQQGGCFLDDLNVYTCH